MKMKKYSVESLRDRTETSSETSSVYLGEVGTRDSKDALSSHSTDKLGEKIVERKVEQRIPVPVIQDGPKHSNNPAGLQNSSQPLPKLPPREPPKPEIKG